MLGQEQRDRIIIGEGGHFVGVCYVVDVIQRVISSSWKINKLVKFGQCRG